MKKFFVVRAVNRQDGSASAPAESFDTEKEARSVFFTRASQATISDNLTDCVLMFTAEGFVVDKVGFNNQPEPETEI